MSYFETRGYMEDRAKFFNLLNRIATALETLAEPGQTDTEEDETVRLSKLALARKARGWDEPSSMAAQDSEAKRDSEAKE